MRRWQIWTALAAFTAVILVLILRDQGQREREETVFHPAAIIWPKGPLTVHIAKDLATYEETIVAALDVWNSRIGCEALKQTAEPFADVRVRSFDGSACGHSSGDDSSAAASAYYCRGFVDVQMRTLDSMGLAHRIALHELGHAMGLDHDDEGAMAATIREPQTGDYPEHMLPSKKDVAALKARLCR